MTSAPPSRHALSFIFFTVLIDTIGFGIVIPVLPELIMELTGKPVNEAARIGGWLAFAYAITQFGCGPLAGNLSDRFGRRPVLIASLLAFAVDYALMGFAPTLALLFVGRIIAGITGASYTTAYAYIADISPPEKRAQNFGLMGMAFGFGFIIGPAIGGLAGEYLGTRAPFFIAGGLALLNAAYGWLVLPESLPPERRRKFDIKRANPVGTLIQLKRYQPVVLGLAAAMFAWQLGHQSLQGTWNFYAIYRFDWSPGMIGASLAAVGVTAAIVQGGLVRIIIPKIGEYRAVQYGLMSGLASFVIYAAATEGWMVYVGILVGALSGLAYPSMNALMSQRVEPDAQGELQGAVASLLSLSTIIGPPLMTQLFGYFTSAAAPFPLPGAAFLLAAVLTLVSLLLFRRATAVSGSDGS
ncbi:TCR/Tet family MFS transporter [Sphingoaurantiacus capsulatus]|uniref:TCR/Tet family MFS transporter n=1 Tax=Sphingoaurantiacus capsulatus TaxID=1771310 RepID=A0ABV7X6I9_9SPHN